FRRVLFRSFAVLLADDLLDAEVSVTRQLVDAAHQHNGSILAIQSVDSADTHRYGIIGGTAEDSRTTRVDRIVEKPQPAEAPSNLAVVGRYVLVPEIFDCLRETEPGIGGEIQLTDAIAKLLGKSGVFGHQYQGIRHDCGSKEGFFRATVELGKKYHGLTPDYSRALTRASCATLARPSRTGATRVRAGGLCSPCCVCSVCSWVWTSSATRC